MKTSSAKAKGRRAAQRVQQLILTLFAEQLTEKDVTVTPSGVTGPDVCLSEAASKLFPYAIEVKNQERLNVWAALEQSRSHVSGTETPLLFFTKNRESMYVAMEAMDFMKILCDLKKR